MNGAAVFLAAFLVFGIYQGVTAESYIDADEIYYAYYMKHISGPWSEESRDWIRNQRNEFIPMLETQKRVNSGELSSDALLAYSSLQQKYSVYQRVVQSNINYYLKENPGAWLVYETGYKKAVRLYRHRRCTGYTSGGAAVCAVLQRPVCHGTQRRHG